MLGDGLARLVDRGFELRLFLRGQRAEIGDHQLVDQREDTAVLLRRRLGMGLRHTRGIERLADLRQESRQLVEARADVAKPIRQRGKVARQQGVDAVAREIGVADGIPAPVFELGQPPRVEFELAGEQPRIDLMRARELGGVQLADRGEQFTPERQPALASRGTDIVELVVVPVIAENRGGHRLQREHLIEVAL